MVIFAVYAGAICSRRIRKRDKHAINSETGRDTSVADGKRP